MKFRKKPVVIEAVQYGLQEYADNPLEFKEVPEWLEKAVEDGIIVPEFRSEDYWYLVIKTLEGNMDVTPGDWVVRGVGGEIYPCKSDIFEITYEKVEE